MDPITKLTLPLLDSRAPLRVLLLLAALASALACTLALPSGAQALEQKVVAADRMNSGAFGRSVAVDGDTAVVGAPGSASGAVYVFTRVGDNWAQTAKLTASDGSSGDSLGQSVAIDGDTIVAGAYLDTVGANTNQGSAYVFERTAATPFTETAKLTASDGAALDTLGESVAIDGDTIVAGVRRDDIGANQDQGSVYTFSNTGATARTETAKLTASDGAAFDQLGLSVDIDGDTIVAGAPADDIGANANQGSAYTFERTAATPFAETGRLIASDGAASDFLGYSVAVAGDTIVAGAFGDDFATTSNQGSAYTFERIAAAFTQTAKLTASDGATNDQFGRSVAIDGDRVISGALGDDIGANTDQGSAYTFSNTGATARTETSKLTASDGAAGDQFGSSVANDGDTVVAGSPFDDGPGSASIFFAAAPSSDLEIQKTDSPDPVIVGEDLTYDLSVTNNGPSDATSVEATDVLPAGVSFKSASANCAEANGTVTCDFGDVANGANESAQIVVTADQVGTVENTASVDGAEDDPNLDNNSSTATTTVEAAPPPPSADLAIEKTDSPDPVSVGGDITYDLSVTGNGPSAASSVEATDVLPAGVSFKSASANCTNAGGTVTCDFGNVENPTETAQIVVTANEAGTVSNTATVDGAEDDPNQDNNSSTATTTVLAAPTPPPPADPSADLSLDIAAPDVREGQHFSYTARVRNAGPDTARSTTLRVTLSPGQRFVAASSGCSYAATARRVTCSLGNLAAGAERSRGITVKATEAGPISARGTVTSSTDDPRPANNSETEAVLVSSRPPVRPPCTIVGTSSNDVIIGTRGNDVICAGRGNDIVRGGRGNDIIYGGAGNDVLRGDAGSDRVFGESGNDVINSSDEVRGNDRNDGGAGSDVCNGDAGDTRRSC